MYFVLLTKIMGDLWFYFRNFQGIQLIAEYNIENEEGILIQGKRNYCLKLKKGKLKTRNLLNVTILGVHPHKKLTDMK